MNKMIQITQYAAGTVLLASAIGLGVFGIATASRDAGGNNTYPVERAYDDDHKSDDHGSEDRRRGLATGRPGAAVMDPVYQEECGACHMAYPPRLLPSASWRAIMSGLGDHFGDNAELSANLVARISEFLDGNASDHGDRMKYARLTRDTNGVVPVRISELPYFVEEHNEIPQRMVKDNPQVQSFSRCDACHKGAAKGQFDEENVVIPGFGHWDS